MWGAKAVRLSGKRENALGSAVSSLITRLSTEQIMHGKKPLKTEKWFTQEDASKEGRCSQSAGGSTCLNRQEGKQLTLGDTSYQLKIKVSSFKNGGTFNLD
jgi:hypothetical protein